MPCGIICRRAKKILIREVSAMLYAIVAVAILICDQAVKLWTNLNLVYGAPPQKFIPGLISLENVHNKGGAFGMGSGNQVSRWLLIIFTILVSIFLIYLLAKNTINGKLGRWMVVFIIAGGIGNLIDRILVGYVVDMFSFDFWDSFAVFNIADIFITVGAIAFCLYLLFSKDPIGKIVIPKLAPSTPVKPQQEKVDYISQLQKPVVEGKKAIEAEKDEAEIAKIETEHISSKEDCKGQIEQPEFSDWNMPFEDSEKQEIKIKSDMPDQNKEDEKEIIQSDNQEITVEKAEKQEIITDENQNPQESVEVEIQNITTDEIENQEKSLEEGDNKNISIDETEAAEKSVENTETPEDIKAAIDKAIEEFTRKDPPPTEERKEDFSLDSIMSEFNKK